jgi:hypothetical protein
MNAMQMHPYFTEIPLRSFEAMAFEGHLSEVLLALIVDPHEAADVAREINEIHETWIELAPDSEAPIALEDFERLPTKDAFEKLKITLAQWVMTTERADIALRILAEWDVRFGIWCACAVAREALPVINEYEQRPSIAVDVAEEWVRGMAAKEDAHHATVQASSYASLCIRVEHVYAAANAAANVAMAATEAAWSIYFAELSEYADDAESASEYSSRSAISYAEAAASASAVATNAAIVAGFGIAYSDREMARTKALFTLREVVANACLTFPG